MQIIESDIKLLKEPDTIESDLESINTVSELIKYIKEITTAAFYIQLDDIENLWDVLSNTDLPEHRWNEYKKEIIDLYLGISDFVVGVGKPAKNISGKNYLKAHASYKSMLKFFKSYRSFDDYCEGKHPHVYYHQIKEVLDNLITDLLEGRLD